MATDVVDQQAEHRFVVRVDGEEAGFARYQRRGSRVFFVHTEIDPAFEGRGLGSALAKGSLDAVRTEGGTRIVPLCPFIANYVERHPEYAELVDRDLLSTIDQG